MQPVPAAAGGAAAAGASWKWGGHLRVRKYASKYAWVGVATADPDPTERPPTWIRCGALLTSVSRTVRRSRALDALAQAAAPAPVQRGVGRPRQAREEGLALHAYVGWQSARHVWEKSLSPASQIFLNPCHSTDSITRTSSVSSDAAVERPTAPPPRGWLIIAIGSIPGVQRAPWLMIRPVVVENRAMDRW